MSFPKFDLDRIGIIASAACVVHCMLTPIFLLFLPALGKQWGDGIVHVILAIGVVPLAGLVIFRGYLRHQVRWVVGVGAAGMCGILIGLLPPATAQIPAPTPAAITAPAIAIVNATDAEQSARCPTTVAETVAANADDDCDACCPDPDDDVSVKTAATESCCPAPNVSPFPESVADADDCGDSCCPPVASASAAEAIAACSDTEEGGGCCPQIIRDPETGAYSLSLSLPAASKWTILGSILLVVAHFGNLRLCACCEENAACESDDCCDS
jgi:hypothetical protein